eukprot:GHVL01005695.1.p1 GENE.GHVL01005695.1~~GHVL01005695.1.p1  ORF type:complete len:152 (+),score=17.89 GHVL01005695.1:29-484(+)
MIKFGVARNIGVIAHRRLAHVSPIIYRSNSFVPNKSQSDQQPPTDSPADLCGRIFDLLDVNKNGEIDKAEIIQMSVKFGETLEHAEKRWESMVKDLDLNKDNLVSREEYVSYWIQKSQVHVNPLTKQYTPEFLDYLNGYIKALKRVRSTVK